MLTLLAVCLLLQGCMGSVIGVVVDTSIAVAKIPFKIGGAVIDVVTSDNPAEENKLTDTESQAGPDAPAITMEARHR